MGNIRGGALTGLMNQPTGQTINGSLLFNGPQYLTRTPGTAGNRKSWTFSTWVKRYDVINTADSFHTIFGANSDGMELMISNSGVFNFYDYSGGAYQYRLVTSRVFRDPTAWFHVVAVADTTNSTAGDRWRLYINGTRVTDFSTETYGSQNYDSGVNSTGLHVLGRYGSGADTVRKANVYLTNTHLIDGSSLDPSYFGFTDPLTNTWRPKKYTGTFGTNGFFLPMDNQDNFEKDKSGNGNDFTKNNFSGTFNDPDVFKDSPSGAVFGGRAQTGITTTSSAPANYATLNPININDMDGTTSVTIFDGNLTVANARNTYFGTALSTLSMTSGKYYCEATVDSNDATTLLCGVLKIDPLESRWNTDDEQIGYFEYGYGYRSNNGNKENNLSNSSYGSSYGNGDIIGIALDLDAKTISFYKNGTGQGVAYSGLPAGQYAFGFSCSETNNKWKANFGQKPFKYAPPQGFLPLNSATARPNTVVPRPDQYVGITTGNFDSQKTHVTGFQPDLIWHKQRNGTGSNFLTDSVRGKNSYLVSNTNAAAGTFPSSGGQYGITSFNFNGWTQGSYGPMSEAIMVAWSWKAGGNKNTFNVDDVGYASAAAAGLDGGSINPSGASVGTKQGFSIIKFASGSSGVKTLSHGLLETPTFALVKTTGSTSDWSVYHKDIGGVNNYLVLNENTSNATATEIWGSSLWTSSVFGINSGTTTATNQDCIAYLWHDVPGLQKFGSFRGNNDTNGAFIELGFRPSLVWIKRTGNDGHWFIIDNKRTKTFNPVDEYSFADIGNVYNPSNGGPAGGIADFLSNGIKLRENNAGANEDDSYIYCAWAEAPASNLFGGQSNAR